MIEFLKKLFTSSPRPLPPEGSHYVYKRGNAYDGMEGIVHHDPDGKTFSIFTGHSWLVGIEP